MSTQPLGPNQTRWVKALRSGRYKQQANGFLRDRHGHCCLGVACRILRITGEMQHFGGWEYGADGDEAFAPDEAIAKLALRDESASILGTTLGGRQSLAEANDDGSPFIEIADFIEAHPEAVFTEPK